MLIQYRQPISWTRTLLFALIVFAYLILIVPMALFLIAAGALLMMTVIGIPLGAVLIASGLKLLWPAA
jgi:hypothetical protein